MYVLSCIQRKSNAIQAYNSGKISIWKYWKKTDQSGGTSEGIWISWIMNLLHPQIIHVNNEFWSCCLESTNWDQIMLKFLQYTTSISLMCFQLMYYQDTKNSMCTFKAFVITAVRVPPLSFFYFFPHIYFNDPMAFRPWRDFTACLLPFCTTQ